MRRPRYLPTMSKEAEYLEWQLQTATQPASYEALLAYAQAKGKPVPKGTREQHEAFLNEYRCQLNANLIRHFRTKAIFGVWPDGRNIAPDLSNVPADQRSFIASQCHRKQYIDWLRFQVDKATDQSASMMTAG